MESKVGCRFLAGGTEPFDRFERPKGPGKKLISCGAKRFCFFHLPSISAVKVKVQEPSMTVSHPCSPDGLMSHEVCVSFEQQKKKFIFVLMS
ncbi:hypothetical protein RHGRI_010052 [Rhododendron griersonianum]|uniref:Uncharacterized protein n=1 Tax=Rhododendron griersonianum TaxID=479676 RepID=A0AAV6KHU2_9ERIC|nr:hypothetical protein RHGRI_010052 [Rhododendron griersonianum]